jgi:hypothetical protein
MDHNELINRYGLVPVAIPNQREDIWEWEDMSAHEFFDDIGQCAAFISFNESLFMDMGEPHNMKVLP